MKWLIKGAPQTSDELTVANAVYSWYASFWRTTGCSSMSCQTCSLLVGCEG